MSDREDDALLAELGEAVREGQLVPARFVEIGKAAFAWRTMDEELAVLSYDSATLPADAMAGTRADPAELRAMTFVSADLTVEVEVADDALLGQLVPPQAGEVVVRTQGGDATTVEVDELGWFAVRPLPAGMFRLHVRTGSGATVVTAWTSL